jgi:hypothetical protein
MSKPPKLCANCKTERYGIRRTGYCHRCSPLIAQKEQVERWDLEDPSTLKRLPSIAYQLPREFPKVKAEKLRELEYRLFLLKANEEKRNQPVAGMDIERAFRRLAEYCGGKEDVMYGIASGVTLYLGPKQRQVLLNWLLDIEESRRWNPKDHWHALHPEEVERMMAQSLEEVRTERLRNRKGDSLSRS